jgi:hypothetical protein
MARPKGSIQKNKRAVARVCERCSKSFSQLGSGRKQKYCCKPTPKTIVKKQGTAMTRGNEIVILDKLIRGECALHPHYHEGRRKYVTKQNHVMFAYDHLDRSIKKGTIAKLKDAGPYQLVKELAKCQLLCHNCHAMKTYEEREYVKHDKQTYEHPTLFDL